MPMKKIILHVRNFILFLRALLSIVRYGTRRDVPAHPPKKVLVVQLAKLGDMVCITPVLRALKQHLPETKVYVLGDALNKKVLEHNQDVDEYIIFDRRELPGVIRRLKEEQINVACIRGIGFIGLALVLLAGIQVVVTSRVAEGKGFETRTYRWLLPYVRTIDLRFGEYMPRQFLRLLEPLGIHADDTTKHLGFSEAADRKINAFIAEKGVDIQRDFVVAVSPSAGHKIKEWPGDRFAEVIDYLITVHGAKILLIGGPMDEEKVSTVLKHSQNAEEVINTQGQLSIDELKALLSKVHLFISVDTGPIYIAEAFGTPTIDITGPIDEREQPPISDIHKVVTPPHRTGPELFVMNAKGYDKAEARRQTESITASMVINTFEELYLRIKK